MTVADSHPALRRDHGAVFSFPDEDGNESAVLVQEVERSQRRTDRREIIASIRAAVVHNHDLTFHDVVLVKPGSIPKTTSGKIQRSLTRDRWLNQRLSLWTSMETTEPSDNTPATQNDR